MANEKYLAYLERKFNKLAKQVGLDTLENKYRKKFERYARYMGNGVYEWQGMKSTDTRELYIMVVLRTEKVKFKEQ